MLMPSQDPAPSANWQFKDDDSYKPASAPADDAVIDWTASEYISHDKSASWYLILAVGALIFTGLVYLLTKDLIIVVTLIVVTILFAVTAARKPRVLHYAITSSGITIGSKTYPFPMFKSFSVIQESGIRSIYLLPMRRFNVPVSLYFPPEEEKAISEAIGLHLAYEDRQQDPIDKIMHRIRF